MHVYVILHNIGVSLYIITLLVWRKWVHFKLNSHGYLRLLEIGPIITRYSNTKSKGEVGERRDADIFVF
jgi:hypothetical protein